MIVVCYGDSNTYGYDPRGFWGGQYEYNWVRILAEKTGWSIQNEGENGREVSALTVLCPDDADLIIVMLGTNNLLQNEAPDSICNAMEQFLMLQKSKKLVLISPPYLQPGAWVDSQQLIDASIQLSRCYEALSRKLNIRFVDAGKWNIPLAFDGVHFTEEGHRVFAEKLYCDLERSIYDVGSGDEST